MKKTLFFSALFATLMLFFMACSGEQTTETDEVAATTEEIVEELPYDGADVVSDAAETIDEELEAMEMAECGATTVDAYLRDPDLTGTNVRKTPGGEVVLVLNKDEIEDDYILTLTETKDGWFKVKSPIASSEHEIEIEGGEAWIHGSVIAVDTRNYDGSHIDLMDSPDGNAVTTTIVGEAFGLRMKDFCGDWVQVEYQGTLGWIKAEMLCGNPFTTCS